MHRTAVAPENTEVDAQTTHTPKRAHRKNRQSKQSEPGFLCYHYNSGNVRTFDPSS
jgi:hypothetical protein